VVFFGFFFSRFLASLFPMLHMLAPIPTFGRGVNRALAHFAGYPDPRFSDGGCATHPHHTDNHPAEFPNPYIERKVTPAFATGHSIDTNRRVALAANKR
jgi:hypothetical protein